MDMHSHAEIARPARPGEPARAAGAEPGVRAEAHAPHAVAPAPHAEAPAPRAANDALRLGVRIVSDPDELEALRPAWEDLSAAALEPNAFYEPWMLVPAWRHLRAQATLRIALVEASDPARPGSPLLTGLFPLEFRRGFKGLPVPVVRLWKHLHCFLTIPLVREGWAGETLAAFFAWLARDSRAALMEFTLIGGEGPFHQALVAALHESQRPGFVLESYTRALFRPAADAEAHLAASLSGRHRKKIRHQEKQLATLGRVEVDALGPGGDVEAWIQEFLALEASGWKGREGSALAANANERLYFETIAREAFRRGQLAMSALRLAGRPIACKCDFLSGRGAFTFKIAFDESYARQSPGLLLEIHGIRRLHAQTRTQWVDSCTHPDNFMFNRIWPARRTIETRVVGTGRAPGDLVVAALPLLAWLSRKLRGRRPAASGSPDPGEADADDGKSRAPAADAR